MGTQKKLDRKDDSDEHVRTGYEKHEAKRTAMTTLITQRLNCSVDDVDAKIRHMSIVENVDEWTALKRYKECAEERRDPYPNVRARERR